MAPFLQEVTTLKIASLGKSSLKNRQSPFLASYIRVYASNPSLASKSPCAAATKAYAKAELESGNTPAKSALLAFIDSAILSNDVGVDPVCSAAANAYIDSFVAGTGRDQKWNFQKGKNI